VRNPDAAAFAHQRVERHTHTAGRRRRDDLAVGCFAVHVRLAVRHHDERPRRQRVQLAGAHQAAPEQQRARQLVDRNQRHQQHLQLRAPARELRRDDGGEAERDTGLRDEPRPRVAADARVDVRGAQPRLDADPDEDEAQPGDDERHDADRRERVHAQRRAHRHEEDHQHRHGAALHGGLQRVALRQRQVLDDQASCDGRQQRLELLHRSDLAEQAAHGNQHQRDFAADVAEVEREQRAHQHAERHGPANLPCEAGDDTDVALRVEGDACELHPQREEDEQRQVGEHDHRQHQLAQRAARAGFCGHRGGHRRREADDDDDQQRDDGGLRQSRLVGCDRQPRPRQPDQRRQRGHRHAERRQRQPRDVRELPAEAIDVEHQPGDERDERRRHAADDLQLSRHRRGNEVAEVRAGEHAEQQVAGDARQLEAAQQVARDPGAEQGEAKGEGRACRSGRRHTADGAYPRDRGDRQRQRDEAAEGHRPGSDGALKADTSCEPVVPITTMVRSTAVSGPSARTAFMAKATPKIPGVVR
jgi:hypothetical protein